jgi:preprotein translocase subunit SecG
MRPLIILLHICVCIALIFIVLIQKGKGAGMGAAFGGSSQTVFGSGGATTFLHKVTTAAAIVFMLTSLVLSIFAARGTVSSVMEGVKQPSAPAAETTQAPAAPAQPQGGESEGEF